ncbi:MAG TPA: orotidine-5'-phosphate decarboxylase [Kiloniellales bacterium]|nr:orotidine-5'-phosphate decarboxylase [Kiloniellales bacterium]
MTIHPRDRLIVALDSDGEAQARRWVERLAGRIGAFKIGKEFFTRFGPEGVARVLQGQRFFLDLKFHDIPNTVAAAVRAALAMRPFMLNVHASGGPAMLQAAAAALAGAQPRPLLIGVTVLTSMDDADLASVGQEGPVEAQVLRLAKLTQRSGLDGVVCSPREITALRRALPAGFKLVVPGVRPVWAAAADQKRMMTPGEAVAAGADYLVVGRPITGAADPAEAARRIVEEMEEATARA